MRMSSKNQKEWQHSNGMEQNSNCAFAFGAFVDALGEAGYGVAKMWQLGRRAVTPSLGVSVRSLYRRETAKVVR